MRLITYNDYRRATIHCDHPDFFDPMTYEEFESWIALRISRDEIDRDSQPNSGI